VLAQRRYELILQALHAEGPVAVSALAERLGVSHATVRRDLALLDEQGQLTRVRGGAAVSSSLEPSFAAVAGGDAEAKDAIARRAAETISDGDVVLLDIGTTVHRLAVYLRGRPITVLTANMAVYDELAADHDVELILLGGVVRRNYKSLVGFLTEAAIRQLRADRMFMGTSGVRADGTVMDTTAIEVPVKRTMIECSDHVVLLADAQKFPGSGFASVCGPESLDQVVTNASPSADAVTAFRERDVEVVHV
jgi:DeoR/GlpR family transcriptional regulator of sugar metabolism